LYSSQPLHDPLYPSSLSSNSETVGLEEYDLKRLRNTAASACFRAKKRLRERGLERGAREKKEKLAALETRIRQLESEKKWLKSLIMEKYNTKKDIEVLRGSLRSEKEVQAGDKKGVAKDDKIVMEKWLRE
jgi:cell shape-determining protein MreC